MNIQEYIDVSYQIAKDKGFWEKPMPRLQSLALMVSEAAEALEADRNNIKRADLSKFEEMSGNELDPDSGQEMTIDDWFKRYVKDTIEDEMADIFIRICNHIGGYDMVSDFRGVDIYDNPDYNFLEMTIADFMSIHQPADDIAPPKDEDDDTAIIIAKKDFIFGEKIYYIMKYLTSIDEEPVEYMIRSILSVTELCYLMDIDLAKHVKYKSEYNSRREYKHGKNY